MPNSEIKTQDYLGIQTSINYAQNEQLTQELKKLKIAEIPKGLTTQENIQPTPSSADTLLGAISQNTYALFPSYITSISDTIALFTQGFLITGIEEETLNQKLKTLPEELNETEEYSIISNFINRFSELSKDSSYIFGHQHQYNIG